jgi:F-type H+-transporting ATPase subunit gamma
MTETASSLQRQLGTAAELHSVVRTMKVMAASRIGQYRDAVAALDVYYRTVQLGLALCLRQDLLIAPTYDTGSITASSTDAIVFGSDQGMVGQFNDSMYQHVVAALAPMSEKTTVWPVGERIAARFADGALACAPGFPLPVSALGIAGLVGTILVALDARLGGGRAAQVLVLHHRPVEGGEFTPVCQRLLPLDTAWMNTVAAHAWPGKQLPELVGAPPVTLAAFINEYLFVSLFRACAESLASENASRLAAMQRAETNIDQLHDELQHSFQRLRQSGIDEELFDLVAGFEALAPPISIRNP